MTQVKVHRFSSVSDIMSVFNEYEKVNFQRCVDGRGLNWWCVVRYEVAHAICVDYGIYGKPIQLSEGKKRRIYRLAGKSLDFAADLSKLIWLRTRQLDALYVGTRGVRAFSQDIEQTSGASLVCSKKEVELAGKYRINYSTLNYLERLLSKAVKLPDDVLAEVKRIDAALRNIFLSDVNFEEIISRKYAASVASGFIWSFILGRLNSSGKFVFLNDDQLKSAVHIAKGKKILTREIQHAYMGKSHEGYCYPDSIGNLSTLPDEVVVFRDTGDIVYPVPIVHFNATTDKMPESTRADFPRDIEVLIGSSPGRYHETSRLMRDLVLGGLSVAVKLHPAQGEDDFRFDCIPHGEAKLEILGGQSDFSEAAHRAMVYVPMAPNSTTALEAAEAGCRVIIVRWNSVDIPNVLKSFQPVCISEDSDFARVISEQLQVARNLAIHDANA